MSEPYIVGTGIDTLKMNVKLLHPDGTLVEGQELPSELAECLQQWQEKARDTSKPCATTMTFHDARMMMYPNGAPAWKYIIRNDCLECKIGPRLHMPMIAKVTLTSAYLWEVGDVHQAVKEVHGFLSDLFGFHLGLQAAQIDLCVDLVGLALPTEWEQVFITHAMSKSPIGESHKDKAVYCGRKLETVNLSGHGRPVSCKIYNKTKEIKQGKHEKTWFYKLWIDHGWDGKSEVWRVEFSLERAGLHEMSLESIDDTFHNIKRLWVYCTCDWLRMVIPGASKNRTRWGTHPTWALLQRAFDTYGDKEVNGLGPLVRDRKRQINIEQAVAAFGGYVTTYAGWGEVLKIKRWEEMTEEECVNALFDLLKTEVTGYWKQRDVQVKELIRLKKFLYSQEP